MIINIKKAFFYIAYFSLVFITMVDGIDLFSRFSDYIKFVIPVSFVVVFIMQSKIYKTKNILSLGIIGTILFISSLNIGTTNLIYLYIFILIFKDIEFDDFIKKDIYIKVFLILLILMLCKLNYIEDVIIYRGDIVRHTFGFPHPNILGTYVTMLSIEVFYLLSEKNNKILYFLLFFSSMFLYGQLNSRTGIVLIVLILILDKLNGKYNFIIGNRFVQKIIPNLFIMLTIISVILGVLYNSNNQLVKKLDEIINKRIYYPSIVLNQYDINLFGNDIRSDKNYLIDNAYINLIINYGMLVTLALYILFNFTLKKLIKEKKYKIVLIFVVLFLFGISESVLYLIKFNPFLLTFALVVNEKNNEIKRSINEN